MQDFFNMFSSCNMSVLFFIIFMSFFSSIPGFNAHQVCDLEQFPCKNGKCVERSNFCNTHDDCGDNSDEDHCANQSECPNYLTFFRCPDDNGKCIPEKWVCDKQDDCTSQSDEPNCLNYTLAKATHWITNEIKKTNALSTNHVLPRIAVSLFLSNKRFFEPGNKTGEHISKELTIQLLSVLLRNQTEQVKINELALYLHGLLVSCVNPRNFYGKNLVSIIRQRVDKQSNYTNPLVLLALCNADDTMTERDVQKLTYLIQESKKPSWTDIQALSLMALMCIKNQNSGLNVSIEEISSLASNMKKLQKSDGSVECLHTTGLVTQALSGLDSNETDIFFVNASNYIVECQRKYGSFLNLMNTYAVLPVLNSKSLRDINYNHCPASFNKSQVKSFKWENQKDLPVHLKLSLWFGDKMDLALTLDFAVKTNSTLLDAMKTAASIDNNYRFNYSSSSSNTYVYSLSGIHNDPENDKFWLLHKFNNISNIFELHSENLLSVITSDKESYLMWYKTSPWSKEEVKARLEITQEKKPNEDRKLVRMPNIRKFPRFFKNQSRTLFL